MPAYYNEIDPYAAQWLRNLIGRGLIAPGDVDERSIVDVRPDDLIGYEQCHFFAGIGGWSYALRLAGVPDDRPVWTGSCPCQPFSAAGKQRGSNDERHLWPAFFDLIRERRPAAVVGEQVAGAAGYAWWDHVAADLEGEGYSAAAADIGAHSVGAPHIRQRLYWVAHADGWHHSAERQQRSGQQRQQPQDGGTGALAHSDDSGRSQQPLAELFDGERPAQRHDADGCGADGLVADHEEHGRREGRRLEQERPGSGDDGADGRPLGDTAGPGPQGREQPGKRADAQREAAERAGSAGGLGDANSEREGPQRRVQGGARVVGAGSLDAWADLEWIERSDGKLRPVKRSIFPLAHGLPKGLVRGGDRRMAPDADQSSEGRVMRLRGYGNAIVPPLAAVFVMAAIHELSEQHPC